MLGGDPQPSMASSNYIPSLSFEHISPSAFIYKVIGKSELSTIGTPTDTIPRAGANHRLRLLTQLKWILQALLRDSPVRERADRIKYLSGDNRNILLRVIAYGCGSSGSATLDREKSTEYSSLRRITLAFLTNATSLLARLRPRVSGEEAEWVRSLVEEMSQAWSRNAQLSYGEASIVREILAFIATSPSTIELQNASIIGTDKSQGISLAFDGLLAASSTPSTNQTRSFWAIHDWLATRTDAGLPENMIPDIVAFYFEATKELLARPGSQYSFPLATYIFEQVALQVHSAYQLPPHEEIVSDNQLIGNTLRILSIEATAFSECFPKHVYIAKARSLGFNMNQRNSLVTAQGLRQTVHQSSVVPVGMMTSQNTSSTSSQPSPSLGSPAQTINQSPAAYTGTPPMKDLMAPGTYAQWAPLSTYSPSHDRGMPLSPTINDVRAYQLPDPVELPTRTQTRKEASQPNHYQALQAHQPYAPQPSYSPMTEPMYSQMQEPTYSQPPQPIHFGVQQPLQYRVLPSNPPHPPQLEQLRDHQTTTYSPQDPMTFYGGLELAEESQDRRPRSHAPPGQQSQIQQQVDIRPLSTTIDEETQSISNLSAVGPGSSRGKRGLFGRFSGHKKISLSPLPASLEFCFSSCAKQILFWCKKNSTSIVRLQYPNKEPEKFEMIVPNLPSSTQAKSQTRSIRFVAAIYNLALALVHLEDDRWLYILCDGVFQPLVEIPSSTPAVLHLALSNDGQTIAIGCGQFILCYQLSRHEVIGPWRLEPNVNFGSRVVRLQKMSFSPDSRRLISAVQIEHNTQQHAAFVSVWSCSDQAFRLEAQLDPVYMTVGYSDDTGISAIFLTGPCDTLAVQQAFLTAALTKSYPSILPIAAGLRNQHLDITDKRIYNASQCQLPAHPHLCAVRSGRNMIALVDNRTGTIEKVADFTTERRGLHLRYDNIALAMQKHDTICTLWRTADENIVLKAMVRKEDGKWGVTTMELGLVYRQATGLAE